MEFRAVLAGCGGMSNGWLKAIQSSPLVGGRVTIVGLVDLDRAAAERLRDAFGLTDVTIGTDLDAVLGETKPDLLFDVVIPAARREVVATGLRHGCHVLSEKPMATSMDEARELLGLAKAAGRVHAIVQNRRFVAGVRRIRRMIAEGTLGQLTGLHADFFIGAHFGGFREQMAHVLLLDMAIHTFDAARYMSGKTPEAVYCSETNPPGSWYREGAAATAVFELSDGVSFSYRGSWVAEGAITSWESAWRITGTEGTLLWDGADSFSANVVDGTEGFLKPLKAIEVPAPEHAEETEGHASVIAGFLDAIAAGTLPETVSSDNIKSLGMVFGAIDSATSRQRMTLPQ